MGWKDDVHGKLLKSGEIKLYFNGGHTWRTKLSQLAKQKGKVVRIVTYSLPDMKSIDGILEKRPSDIFLICNEKFIKDAQRIKIKFPKIRIATYAKVHSKVVLIEPDTVYVSSANFGNSGWHETSIGIRSKTAHDEYVKNSFDKLWDISVELK